MHVPNSIQEDRISEHSKSVDLYPESYVKLPGPKLEAEATMWSIVPVSRFREYTFTLNVFWFATASNDPSLFMVTESNDTISTLLVLGNADTK